MSTTIKKTNIKTSTAVLGDEPSSEFKDIIKKFGSNIIQEEKKLEEKYFSTGSLMLDQLMGRGYPYKRIIEVFGQPGTGKTTLSLHAIKEIQNIDSRKTAFFDIEKSLNIEYAKKIGVDFSRNLILRPKNAEQTFDFIFELLKTNKFSLIVIDSVAALLPQEEKEKDMSDGSLGLQARIMSKALRKINGELSISDTSIIFINQIREKIKVMFGNPEVTSGGNALKFYASIRIELRNRGKIIEGEKSVGQLTKVRIVKNKLSTPFGNGVISIFFGEGISKIEETINSALEKEILTKKGNWFWYNNERIALGLKGIRKKLKEDSVFFKKIEKNLLIKN